MKNVGYGYVRVLEGMSFDEAISKITEALKTEGFGILTEIDVKATLKKKLDVDFRPYKILGACNPPLAHQALTHEDQIGLVLPCNVVVQEDTHGNTVVSIVDPKAMFAMVKNPDMEHLVSDVDGRVQRVLDAL